MKYNMTGNVFHIQRFSTQDGPGIRTVVFLKGCPLSCIWCHNPESKSSRPEIFYDAQKCVSCKLCAKVCPNQQHLFPEGRHIFLRNSCTLCMKCVNVCVSNALEACGTCKSVDAVLDEILRDTPFYEQSNGGITLSGGEPLLQYDFSLELLKRVKEHGIHTAVETSGFCFQDLSEISRSVDVWLYDVKLISEKEHIKYTGASNQIILKNLHFLDGIGAKIILRCPIIPDINLTKEHFSGIANLVNSLKNVVAIHFEPYHPLGVDKALRLGMHQQYENREFLSGDRLLPFVDVLRDKTKAKIEIL